jgi:hypothetical protein
MTRAYVERVSGAAALARDLSDMARRQSAGSPLTTQEYTLIEQIGSSVEHDFLLFKSVHLEGGGLSEPDPISKIADVAFFEGRRLMAAVGQPLEWNQSVGKAGARQLMRGAIYSYFEFEAAQPWTDDRWRELEKSTPRPAWIARFLTPKPIACTSVR